MRGVAGEDALAVLVVRDVGVRREAADVRRPARHERPRAVGARAQEVFSSPVGKRSHAHRQRPVRLAKARPSAAPPGRRCRSRGPRPRSSELRSRPAVVEEDSGCRWSQCPSRPAGARIRQDAEVRPHHGDPQRQVDVTEPVCHRAALVHVGLDRVVGGHDVGAPAAELEIIVREHRRHGVEIHAFELVEAEVLVVEADPDLALTDRLGALGEDRAEALGRAAGR